jgi:2-dehydro-3-deoxyglucarate aldolase
VDRLARIDSIRQKLRNGQVSLGSWMQLPHASVAEIMGQAGYDWVAVDLEHGSIAQHQLPDMFRALELGSTLPLVRLAVGEPRDCKSALDAGAGGIIAPMIESAEQLERVVAACRWPPAGTRGIGFSRANLFGRQFETYSKEAQRPLIVAQIEHVRAVRNLEHILRVPGLDAIMIGPYDLSASLGLTAQFDHPDFKAQLETIKEAAAAAKVPAGVHVVEPSAQALNGAVASGFRFIAYSIDAVFLEKGGRAPGLEAPGPAR